MRKLEKWEKYLNLFKKIQKSLEIIKQIFKLYIVI